MIKWLPKKRRRARRPSHLAEHVIREFWQTLQEFKGTRKTLVRMEGQP
jgi:hypothetical protein